MTSNIEKQSFGQAGALIATDTSSYTGDYCAICFIAESTLTSLTWAELDGSGDDGTTPTYPAGFVIYGQITEFTLATGSAVAYKQA